MYDRNGPLVRLQYLHVTCTCETAEAEADGERHTQLSQKLFSLRPRSRLVLSRPSRHRAHMPGTTSKIEVLLLKLWASKQDAVAVTAICKELLEEAPNDLRGVDMYLPQFAHMVIACADDLQTIAPIEHFLLTISQLSIHLALHFRKHLHLEFV